MVWGEGWGRREKVETGRERESPLTPRLVCLPISDKPIPALLPTSPLDQQNSRKGPQEPAYGHAHPTFEVGVKGWVGTASRNPRFSNASIHSPESRLQDEGEIGGDLIGAYG